MHKYIILFSFFLFPKIIIAQDVTADLKWSKESNNSIGPSISFVEAIIDDSQNVCVCALASIFSGVDLGLLAIKYDSLGNQIWQNIYNTLALERLWDCAMDNQSNLFIAGTTTYVDVGTAIRVIKYSPIGEQIWFFDYFEPFEEAGFVRAILPDEIGNVYLIGTDFIENDTAYMTVFKLNENGELVWKNHYQPYTRGSDGFLLEDRIVALGEGGGKYIIKQIDFNGETISATENDKDDEYFKYIEFDKVGNVYFGDEARQYKVVKIDVQGDTLWYYELPVVNPPGTGVYARLTALDADEQGNIYVSGSHYDDETGGATVTTKLNENGEVVWSDRYGELNIPPHDILVTDELVLVGSSTSLDTANFDYLLLIYSLDGELLLDLRYDHNGNLYEQIASVAAYGNNVYVTGETSLSFNFSDSTYLLTQRYKLDGLVAAHAQEKIIQGVNIFPNPFIDQIQINQKEAPYFFNEYLIHSVAGGLVKKGNLTETESQIGIDTSLSGGIYLLTLKAKNGVEMRKVLVRPD